MNLVLLIAYMREITLCCAVSVLTEIQNNLRGENSEGQGRARKFQFYHPLSAKATHEPYYPATFGECHLRCSTGAKVLHKDGEKTRSSHNLPAQETTAPFFAHRCSEAQGGRPETDNETSEVYGQWSRHLAGERSDALVDPMETWTSWSVYNIETDIGYLRD